MLRPETRLEPNTIEIAAKILDGEAILINLSTGVYYSMDKVGVTVWMLINDGYSIGDIANALSIRYEVDAVQVQNDLQQVIDSLIQENIVTPVGGSNPGSRVEPRDTALMSGTKEPYESPNLNIYRDMGDLLALDPPMPGLANLSEFNEE
jgi:hypothetical protein